uniref:Uncharacterized protein n=1 Tax=Sciurus vulgaris TaxID=55149 RepID=A0A8D2DAE7_SCIVU
KAKGLSDNSPTDCKLRSVSVDLNVDPSLQIDIPDALGDRDKVKFTTCTKTTQSTFQSPEFSVTRPHENFAYYSPCSYRTRFRWSLRKDAETWRG